MERRSSRLPFLVAVVIGASLWWVAAFISGRREAWDGAAYWVLAYPLSVVACACLGYSYPERPWRWALLLFQGQFVAMCLRDGEVGNLWPLGMALFAIMALPGVLVAKWTASFNRRSRGAAAEQAGSPGRH
jgi:hypothetical protein